MAQGLNQDEHNSKGNMSILHRWTGAALDRLARHFYIERFTYKKEEIPVVDWSDYDEDFLILQKEWLLDQLRYDKRTTVDPGRMN